MNEMNTIVFVFGIICLCCGSATAELDKLQASILLRNQVPSEISLARCIFSNTRTFCSYTLHIWFRLVSLLAQEQSAWSRQVAAELEKQAAVEAHLMAGRSKRQMLFSVKQVLKPYKDRLAEIPPNENYS